MCYVDDVVIANPTLKEDIERLDKVFTCMKQAGLKCKSSKCQILRISIKYLGRLGDKHGVRPHPEAVEAVLIWKALKTDTELMSFLGFANYYREFIKGSADMIYLMRQLIGIRVRNPAGLTRLKSLLRTSSAHFARLRTLRVSHTRTSRIPCGNGRGDKKKVGKG